MAYWVKIRQVRSVSPPAPAGRIRDTVPVGAQVLLVWKALLLEEEELLEVEVLPEPPQAARDSTRTQARIMAISFFIVFSFSFCWFLL